MSNSKSQAGTKVQQSSEVEVSTSIPNNAKPNVGGSFGLANWLLFTDFERGNFQFFFQRYLLKNENQFNVHTAYNFALLGRELQFQMRILEGRIYKHKDIQDNEIVINNNWVSQINSYTDLCKFIVDEFVSSFENMPLEKQYEYKKNNVNSYFLNPSKEEHLKENINSLLRIGLS